MKSHPLRRQEKIDRYILGVTGNRSDSGSDGDVQCGDSCVAQGWRSRGQRKKGGSVKDIQYLEKERG